MVRRRETHSMVFFRRASSAARGIAVSVVVLGILAGGGM
jgi:hypothetical protein